jgi:hypothetical protein
LRASYRFRVHPGWRSEPIDSRDRDTTQAVESATHTESDGRDPAFLNTKGGRVLIGVGDAGDVPGIEQTAEWANTTIAAGDTKEEIDKLRQGGAGHIVAGGGVSFWRSRPATQLLRRAGRVRRPPCVLRRS